MHTKNPRINVALEKPIYSLIERMAQERGLSLSMVTRDLVREALESEGHFQTQPNHPETDQDRHRAESSSVPGEVLGAVEKNTERV